MVASVVTVYSDMATLHWTRCAVKALHGRYKKSLAGLWHAACSLLTGGNIAVAAPPAACVVSFGCNERNHYVIRIPDRPVSAKKVEGPCRPTPPGTQCRQGAAHPRQRGPPSAVAGRAMPTGFLFRHDIIPILLLGLSTPTPFRYAVTKQGSTQCAGCPEPWPVVGSSAT